MHESGDAEGRLDGAGQGLDLFGVQVLDLNGQVMACEHGGACGKMGKTCRRPRVWSMFEVAMLCAVLIPFFSDEILGLDGLHIGLWGWLFSLVGQQKCRGCMDLS